MTYKQIYKQLDRAGLIDKLVIETNDKIGIIRGIEYLEYFLNSRTFEDMQYWQSSEARETKRTESKVCVEYAKLQIANKEKHLAKYEYMAKTMEVA